MNKVKIDKSLLTQEEQAQYDTLIAKATVKPDANEGQGEDGSGEGQTGTDGVQKAANSAEGEGKTVTKTADTIMQSTIARMEAIEKNIEMTQFTAIAKKYAPIGEKEQELAEVLYGLSKSDKKAYDSFVAVLDRNLELAKNSGLFTEIGKSGSSTAGGSVEAKIETKAAELMKSDPNLNHTEAIAKAWQQSPDLIAEYEAEFKGGK